MVATRVLESMSASRRMLSSDAYAAFVVGFAIMTVSFLADSERHTHSLQDSMIYTLVGAMSHVSG